MKVIQVIYIFYRYDKDNIETKTFNIYYLPFDQLFVFNNENLNNHKGLGPVHFYALNNIVYSDMYEEICSESLKKSMIDAQKEARDILIKFMELRDTNEVTLIYSDDLQNFYAKDDISNDIEIDKIIFIHYSV
jgi:hypothetical protein